MNYSQTIESLNGLIQINYDRINVYERAITNINMGEFCPVNINIMQDYIKDSQHNIEELSKYIQKSGNAPKDCSTNDSGLYRLWKDIKMTFSFHEKDTVLTPCIAGDHAAITAYEIALVDVKILLMHDLGVLLSNQIHVINLACNGNERY